MKVLLGHLDWVLGTKGPHSDPTDETFLGLCTVSNVSKWSNVFVKNGVKTYVAGSYTNTFLREIAKMTVSRKTYNFVISYKKE